MIVGLGIDVIEVARLAEALRRHGDRFERRVYTEAELAACSTRGDRVLALAARFAAKEACMKALGTGWAEGIGFRDVEIAREDNRLLVDGHAARAYGRLQLLVVQGLGLLGLVRGELQACAFQLRINW